LTDEADGPERPSPRRFALVSGRVPLQRAMLLLLVLAMLPLSALALLQGMARLDSDARALSDRLGEAALFTASAEQNIIDNSEGLLRILAENPLVRGADKAACSRELEALNARFPAYSNLALIEPDGRILCSAIALRMPPDARIAAGLWQEVQQTTRLLISPPMIGPFTHQRVIWLAVPLRDRAGRFQGAISASVNLDLVGKGLRERYSSDDSVILLLDAKGAPVATSKAVPWRRLDVSGDPGAIHEARDADGRRWVYAVAPIRSQADHAPRFYVAYLGQRARLAEPDWWFVGGHVALPVLALLFSSAAILIGVRWGILRWIEALRQLAAEYARGNYRARDDAFEDAPQELRDLAASLYRMAHTIEQRDRILTEAMARQTALAREINHRVKNNLQIIISLLSLQARALPDESARSALGSARLRVGALALVHRLLYETDELASVSTRRLIGDLCGLVEQHYALANVRMHCDADEVGIDIDHAVPLTLWWVEAASDALVRASGREEPVAIGVSLRADGGDVVTDVCDDAGSAGADPDQELRLRRLLTAISRQLGGATTIGDEERGRRVCLRFPVSRASAAEQRPATGVPAGMDTAAREK
jgi:two-component sensor histidine kinase